MVSCMCCSDWLPIWHLQQPCPALPQGHLLFRQLTCWGGSCLRSIIMDRKSINFSGSFKTTLKGVGSTITEPCVTSDPTAAGRRAIRAYFLERLDAGFSQTSSQPQKCLTVQPWTDSWKPCRQRSAKLSGWEVPAAPDRWWRSLNMPSPFWR